MATTRGAGRATEGAGAAATAEPGRKRGRGLRWALLLFFVLFLALLILGPTLAAPFVKSATVDALETRFGGEASIGELGLSWPGSLRLEDVRATGPAGQDVLWLGSLDGSIEIAALLGGTYAVDAALTGLELHVREEVDGSWSIPGTEGTGEDEESEPEPFELPEIVGSLTSSDGTIVLHGRDGATSLEDIDASIRLDGRANPIQFDLSAGLRGADGDAGRLLASGEIEIGEAVELASALSGRARLEAGDVDLASLQPFLAEAMPDRRVGGRLDSTFELAGTPSSATVQGKLSVREFLLEIPEGRPDGSPLSIEDPELSLELDAEIGLPAIDVDLRRLQLTSVFAHGSITGKVREAGVLLEEDGDGPVVLEGLTGDLAYHPDRLGALLEPWLPGKLSGTEEERVSFRLDGEVGALDLASLTSGLSGSASVGLGHLELDGLEGSGDLTLEAEGGRAVIEGDLTVNGGTVALSGETFLGRPAQESGAAVPTTRLRLEGSEVGVSSRLSPLLAFIHPAFAALESMQMAEVGGAIGCELEVSYGGPVTPETFSAGVSGVALDRLHGSGSFSIDRAQLAGSPFLGEVLGLLGVDASKDMRIRPVRLLLDAGRISYGNPWTWTIDDVETTFTGSVGLDTTLGLSWNVPITDGLVAEHDFLKPLQGEEITVPIGGTIKSPKVELSGLISGLANDAAKRALADELLERVGADERKIIEGVLGGEGLLEGVEGLGGEGGLLDELGIGGGREESGEEGSSGKRGPQELLDEADRLWDAGRKTEAAALYREIREEHKLSLVYTLNRSRIKERGKHQE